MKVNSRRITWHWRVALWVVVIGASMPPISDAADKAELDDPPWKGPTPSFGGDGASSGYPGRLDRRREKNQVVDDLVYNHWLIYAPSGR